MGNLLLFKYLLYIVNFIYNQGRIQNFKLHGIPISIVFDRDPVFTTKFWAELFKLQGVQLAMSSTYHLQLDGQTKVVNKSLEHYLRSFSSDRPTKWLSGCI